MKLYSTLSGQSLAVGNTATGEVVNRQLSPARVEEHVSPVRHSSSDGATNNLPNPKLP